MLKVLTLEEMEEVSGGWKTVGLWVLEKAANAVYEYTVNPPPLTKEQTNQQILDLAGARVTASGGSYNNDPSGGFIPKYALGSK